MTGTIEKFGIVTCSKDEFLITGFTLVGYSSIQDAGLAVLQWVADKIRDNIEYVNSVGPYSTKLLSEDVSLSIPFSISMSTPPNNPKRGNNG